LETRRPQQADQTVCHCITALPVCKRKIGKTTVIGLRGKTLVSMEKNWFEFRASTQVELDNGTLIVYTSDAKDPDDVYKRCAPGEWELIDGNYFFNDKG
jgi:hypothetical protein